MAVAFCSAALLWRDRAKWHEVLSSAGLWIESCVKLEFCIRCLPLEWPSVHSSVSSFLYGDRSLRRPSRRNGSSNQEQCLFPACQQWWRLYEELATCSTVHSANLMCQWGLLWVCCVCTLYAHFMLTFLHCPSCDPCITCPEKILNSPDFCVFSFGIFPAVYNQWNVLLPCTITVCKYHNVLQDLWVIALFEKCIILMSTGVWEKKQGGRVQSVVNQILEIFKKIISETKSCLCNITQSR